MDFFDSTIQTGPLIALELLAAGAIFFVLEKIKPAEKDISFFKPEFTTEALIALVNKFLVMPLFALLSGLAAVKAMTAYAPYQVFNDYILLIPFGLQVIFGLFIMDFSTYWRHRLMHKFLWPVHSIHHSAKHLTWITGLRLHPLEIFIALFIDAAFMHVFGFSGKAIFFSILLSTIYNYYLHANLNIQYDKPIRYILASPHFHRWHHATDRSAYDKNFCSMFSLLDVMFGTYYHPEGVLPKAYGLSDAEQKKYPSGLLPQLAYPIKKLMTRKKKKKPETK